MSNGARGNRMYKASPLPIVRAAAHDGKSTQIRLAELNEASATWRMLTDVRFKLLALLPPVAALGLATIVSPKGPLEGAEQPVRVAAAGFGFLVTLGLWIYDRRNDELYDDAISRGRRAEFELGVDTGVFRGRKKARPLYKSRFKEHPRLVRLVREYDGDFITITVVSHGVALGIVYCTVLAAWFLAGLFAAIGLIP